MLEEEKEILKERVFNFKLNKELSSKMTKEVIKENEAIEKLLAELEEKDKIIDLMSDFINNYDIDEEICAQVVNCNDFINKEKCKECIKEYFEKRIQEEN